jgi:hypothetical protein
MFRINDEKNCFSCLSRRPSAPFIKCPPWVGSRSPDGWDQIPRWVGGWVLHQPPWSFGFDSQTRGTRKTGAPCIKVPGSSRVPQNISFLPAIMSTSNRMHGEFLRLLFLQVHRETEAHFTAAGMPSQRNQSESFRFKRAAFYQGLKSKVGLAAAKAAALRINLNVQGCSIVAAPMHAPSRTSLLLPLLLSHNLPRARVH